MDLAGASRKLQQCSRAKALQMAWLRVEWSGVPLSSIGGGKVKGKPRGLDTPDLPFDGVSPSTRGESSNLASIFASGKRRDRGEDGDAKDPLSEEVVLAEQLLKSISPPQISLARNPVRL